jgi:hypothetical protein
MRIALVGLSLAATMALVWTNDAGAQEKKKLTYEQAWAACKKELTLNAPGADSTQSATRHTAGAACMRRYGYRLKK